MNLDFQQLAELLENIADARKRLHAGNVQAATFLVERAEILLEEHLRSERARNADPPLQ